MDERPLVSIIIPVYNIEQYLAATLDSVLAQTYQNFELILIDDGSTDASGSICLEYARKDGRIRTIHQSNGGVSAARNRGVREARGDYVMFLDSDDLFEPEMVGSCVQAATSHNATLVIFGMFFDSLTNGALKKRTIRSHQDAILTRETLKSLYMDLFHANYLTSSCNKLFSRPLIVEHHLVFDESLSSYEDLLFNLRYLPFVDKGVVLSQPYYHYCRRSERRGLSSGGYIDGISDKMLHLIAALQQQYAELNLLDELPQLAASAQVFYVQGLCNLCLNDDSIAAQARAAKIHASNPIFSRHEIFAVPYGNVFVRLCRWLTLHERWTLLVIVCQMRNMIRR